MATQGDALGYALLPFQGVNGYVGGIYTQGVASLALGYALVGLSARLYALMPLQGRAFLCAYALSGRLYALMPFRGACLRI